MIHFNFDGSVVLIDDENPERTLELPDDTDLAKKYAAFMGLDGGSKVRNTLKGIVKFLKA